MPSARDHRTGLLSLHIAVLLFGVAGLFGKWLPLMSPLWIVFGRTAFAAVSLGLLLLCLKPATTPQAAPPPRPGGLWRLAVPGVVLAVHWVSFFKAIQVSTVAVGLLTYSTFPLFTTLLEPLAFRERLRPLDLLTALLVLAGLAVMVRKPDLGDRVTLGACWGTVSGLAFAVLSLLNRRLVRDRPPVRLALGQNAAAAAVLLPLLFLPAVRGWAGGGGAGPRGLRDVLLLAVLGVGCTALAHTLFIHGLSRARAQVASVIGALEPVYGILFALLVLHEVPTKWTLAGGGIILCAVVVASLRPPAAPAAAAPPGT